MIELRHIHKSFGTRRVLNDLSLTLREGARLGLVGGSGAGKTVLLRIILGLETPDGGEILLDGAPPSRAARKTQVAQTSVLSQSGTLFDHLPVWENIAFPELYGPNRVGRLKARVLAMAAMERVGLPPDVALLMPENLSGGMHKRAALARAIITPKRHLILDEPTTGLDPITAQKITALIAELADEMQAGIFTITHDAAALAALAHEVAFLENGSIAWQGRFDDLKPGIAPLLDMYCPR